MFLNIRAVLFDLDGTLIDSAPDLGAAADKMRTDRGLPSLPLERYRPMAGAGARGMLAEAFGLAPDHPDFAVMREEFFKNYGLTPEKLALAKPDAIVMHPGPINRGVEIDSAVADGRQSVILPQVTFGIAVRMAVMSIIAGNNA